MPLSVSTTVDLSAVPSELIHALALEASRDAAAVICFLQALSDTPAGAWLRALPVRLPREFLLNLGAALRLCIWECKGIHVHREMSLPTGREALVDVFRAATDADAAARSTQLATRVVALFIDRFAWIGRSELRADLVLGSLSEDALVNAMAEFLWAHRNRGRTELNGK